MAPLISSSKLASLLGISRQQIWNLATGGVIPSYRPGRSLRFDLEEVLAALRKKNVVTT